MQAYIKQTREARGKEIDNSELLMKIKNWNALKLCYRWILFAMNELNTFEYFSQLIPLVIYNPYLWQKVYLRSPLSILY